jgi:hypothetical protein
MAAIGTAVPILGAGGLTAAAAVAGSAVGSAAVAASFGGINGLHLVKSFKEHKVVFLPPF